MKAIGKACVAFALLAAPGIAADSPAVDLATLSRSIAKEQVYKGVPHYSLVVIGPQAEHRSWMVMDGDDLLYFDRNGNGDLTEAEDRIECDRVATNRIHLSSKGKFTGMNVFPIGTVAGVNLKFEFWVRNKAFVPTSEQSEILRAYDKLRADHHWENSTLLRADDHDYQVQNPVVMTATAAEAQITHLSGPLQFALKRGDRQKLEPWPKQSIFDVHIGTRTLPPKHYTQEMLAPLTEWEPPRNLHPVALFKFPPKVPGGQPVELAVDLNRRCCGDTLYAQMTVPRDAGEGHATVILTYDAWKDRAVQPTVVTVPIGGESSLTETAQSFVMFKWNPIYGMSAAFDVLRQQGLNVRKTSAEDKTVHLVLHLQGKPAVGISLNTKPLTLETAKALGEGTPFETALRTSDARYEVSLTPATLLEEEQETLKLVLKTLAKQTGGTVYTTWDKRLSADGQ